jgi:hypothetical protein
MKYLLATLLTLILRVHAANAEEESKIKSTPQRIECGDFSSVGFKDRDAFLKYLADLKAAKTDEDFAKLVTYPLRINRKPKLPLYIKDEAAFQQNFKEVFSDKVIDAIRKAEQKDNFCNYQGMSVGNGTVWIDNKNNRTGIFVINQ